VTGQTATAQTRTDGIAFLLAQLGRHATDLFTERIAALDLTPPQAGILRAISAEPGRSQQALSERLGLLPSRIVALIDDLEQRTYLERRRHPSDRRLHAMHLTSAGEQLMLEVAALARQHEHQITAGLDSHQRATLAELLGTLVGRLGLEPGVHPGYRRL
jgi:DNA-binding MarR family transcriptional regulator